MEKLCRFNFNRQETTAGHCKRPGCKFLHPDPPLVVDDPLWCPDDFKEQGGSDENNLGSVLKFAHCTTNTVSSILKANKGNM